MISPYVRRLRLAGELRQLRAASGLTHEQLSRRTGVARAQLSRLENGRAADQDDVIKILDALGVDGHRWSQVLTIAREAGERGWWESHKAMGARQALYANLEAGAESIREYQQTFLPGLVQTAEFARARTEIDLSEGSPSYDVDKAVEARMTRQRMLRRPDGPTYEVILDEVAIRRLSAPREIVGAQLRYLAGIASGDEQVTIRVLPVDAVIGGYSVPRSAFGLYGFADPDDPTVVTVDTVSDDLVLTAPETVARYAAMYDRLREVALPVETTVDYLIKAAETLPEE